LYNVDVINRSSETQFTPNSFTGETVARFIFIDANFTLTSRTVIEIRIKWPET